MPKKELGKLIGFSLIINIVALYFSTKLFPNIFLQSSFYLIIIFLWLICYLAYFIKKFHLNENYRNLVNYKKLIVISISIIIFILISDAIFYYEPQVTKFFTKGIFISSGKDKNTGDKKIKLIINIIDSIFKFLTSSAVLTLFIYLISKINDYRKAYTLEIQLFNVATFSDKTDIIIPNDTKQFNLSLHNFSRNTVDVFFLGICREDVVKDILEKKDWDKIFFNGKLPKGPKSFEKIKPNDNSKLQIINVAQLEKVLSNSPSLGEGNGYRLCAIYYVQEGENINLPIVKKHFVLEYNKKDKEESGYYNSCKAEMQYYQLTEQVRNYNVINPDSDYRNAILRMLNQNNMVKNEYYYL